MVKDPFPRKFTSLLAEDLFITIFKEASVSNLGAFVVEEPLKVIVSPDEVKVPLLVKVPSISKFEAALISKSAPEPIANVPFTSKSAVKSTSELLELLIAKLLK